MHCTLTCPGCGVTFEIARETPGETISCPHCARQFRLRRLSSDPPAPPPLPPPLPGAEVAAGPPLRREPRARRTGSLWPTWFLGAVFGLLLVGAILAVAILAFLAGRNADVGPLAGRPTATAPAAGLAEFDKPSTAADAAQVGDGSSADEDGTAPGDQPGAAAAKTHDTDDRKDLVALIEAVEPSVVRLNVKTAKSQAVGSGFVVDTAGTIVTNFHVVEDARSIEARFHDGTAAPVVGVLYVEPAKDIALIQTQCPSANLHPLPLADKEPRKGEAVAAFGAPLGLSFSATNGIVSALRSGNDITSFLSSLGLSASFGGTWIQTTAPISHGNSGGPLVDPSGHAVGMNTMTFNPMGGENINFAISATDIQRALRQAAGQTPQPLASAVRKSQKAGKDSTRPALDYGKIFVKTLAFQNHDMKQTRPRETAAFRSRVVAALQTHGFQLVMEPEDAGWALVLAANYNRDQPPAGPDSGETCDIALGFFERDVRSGSDAEATLFWERKLHLRGSVAPPPLSADSAAKLENAFQELRRFLRPAQGKRGPG